MSETPDQTRTTRSAYLHVLPDGWQYDVAVTGPQGQRVTIAPVDDGPAHRIVYATGEDQREQTAATLADACKAAVAGIKVLHRIAQGEAEVARAREQALSVLGGGSAHSTAPADQERRPRAHQEHGTPDEDE